MLICCASNMSSDMSNAPSSKSRDSMDQDQFLNILSREEALKRFEAALFPRAIPSEQRPLSGALGCALAQDIVAPIDVPPFDRSNVDGFAVRRSEEHTSELQSRGHLVCRLLLEKKKKKYMMHI